jgi:hypothetical protein
VGEYACYAYGPTGTIRQTAEIKFIDDHFRININKPTRRIGLIIEQRDENFDNSPFIENPRGSVPVLGNSYVFDCITDSIWPVKWRKLNTIVHDSNNDPHENAHVDHDQTHRTANSYMIKKSIISFSSLSESDFGEYICVSSNLFGKSGAKLIISQDSIETKNLSFMPHSLGASSSNKRLNKKLLMNKYNNRLRAKLAASARRKNNRRLSFYKNQRNALV